MAKRSFTCPELIQVEKQHRRRLCAGAPTHGRNAPAPARSNAGCTDRVSASRSARSDELRGRLALLRRPRTQRWPMEAFCVSCTRWMASIRMRPLAIQLQWGRRRLAGQALAHLLVSRAAASNWPRHCLQHLLHRQADDGLPSGMAHSSGTGITVAHMLVPCIHEQDALVHGAQQRQQAVRAPAAGAA